MSPITRHQLLPLHRHPAAAAAKSLLSAVIPGVLEPQRPLATVRLPGKGQAAICALTQEAEDGGEGSAAERETRLAVATAGGLGVYVVVVTLGGRICFSNLPPSKLVHQAAQRCPPCLAEGMLYSYRLEVPAGLAAAGCDSSGGSSLRASIEGEWSLLTGR